MEQEHLIIVAILAVVLYMLMKYSKICDCSQCKAQTAQRIRYEMPGRINGMPERIRTREGYECPPGEPGCGPMGHIRSREGYEPLGPLDGSMAHIRVGDCYMGKSQLIKQHLRYDNKEGMFAGMFAGQHIRTNVCEGGIPC
jgi:hypothetical protein